MNVIPRRLVPAALASIAMLAVATGAWAHASLEDSDPPEGGSISTPYVLVAQFDEELSGDGSSITVRNAGGDIVATGGLGDDAFHMVAELPALPEGAYVAHWIAITVDDNGKTQGDINFTVVATTPSPAPTAVPTATAAAAASPTTAPPASESPAAPTPSVTPTPPPSTSGTAGSELILPIVLGAAVVAALAYFLIRRRPPA